MSLFYRRSNRAQFALWIAALLVVTTLIAGCDAVSFDDPSSIPGVNYIMAPTATYTPSPVPTPTDTPLPTATPKPGETPLPPTATPVPTPKVTIPNRYTVTMDDRLKYSFAVPRGWTALDLKGAQFRQILQIAGQASQVPAIDAFLETKEGKQLGKIYISDLLNAMSGGLPSAIVVYVLDAPGYTAESAKELVDGLIKANAAMLGDVKIDTLEATTINNLPAVRAAASANLAKVGMNASAYVKVAGLIANDQIYIMLLLTQESSRGAKEPIFDAVIGTFRPE